MSPSAAPSWPARARMRAGAAFADGFFRTASRLGRMHPQARPERHGVVRIADIPYQGTGSADHHLDVYRPAEGDGPWPVVLYIHGGGFRILSKDTHWVMALAFARRGFVVFNVNYRLAPAAPYPAAVEDVCAALQWVVEHAPDYGGDPSRMVFAGESAGANLSAALTVACCYERPEPFARAAFQLGVVPRAVVPACGILQVSDPGRFGRRRRLPAIIEDRILEVSGAYLGDRAHAHHPDIGLADPLCLLEAGHPPARPLPPFFATVGTADPVLDDTRRLVAAVRALGGEADARYYPREPHAFHAFVVREPARRCWQDTFEFLEAQGLV